MGRMGPIVLRLSGRQVGFGWRAWVSKTRAEWKKGLQIGLAGRVSTQAQVVSEQPIRWKIQNTMIRLFTVWFDANNPGRQAEIRECAERNLKNHAIGQVIFWQDSGLVPFNDSKVKVHPAIGRPTFSELFALANRICAPGDIAIVANSDIWFDDTIALVQGMPANVIYTLLRYEKDGRPYSGEAGPAWHSQDSWIFCPPIQVKNVDFKPGMPRCDNALAHRFWRAGYLLQNPALTIRSHHLHPSKLRVYHDGKDRVVRPWMHIEPTELGQPGGMRVSPPRLLQFLGWRTVMPDAYGQRNIHRQANGG